MEAAARGMEDWGGEKDKIHLTTARDQRRSLTVSDIRGGGGP